MVGHVISRPHKVVCNELAPQLGDSSVRKSSNKSTKLSAFRYFLLAANVWTDDVIVFIVYIIDNIIYNLGLRKKTTV